jgi:hypothetical protein
MKDQRPAQRIALVGNGLIDANSATEIDACDHVVRFNKANGWGGNAGTRTDTLYLVNHGGQMKEWIDTDILASMPQVLASRRIALPIPMLNGHVAPGTPGAHIDQLNFISEASRRLQEAGHHVVAHTVADYRTAVERLRNYEQLVDGPSTGHLHPSTGFLALSKILSDAASNTHITLWGFTFEGWGGHPWELERRFAIDHVAIVKSCDNQRA